MTSLFTGPAPVAYACIAVERGIDRYPHGLTYGVPANLAELAPGDRVIVPLGRGDRPTAGYIIEMKAAGEVDAGAFKLIERRDAAAIRLPSGLIELARWISSYYVAPIGMTLNAMLPAAVKHNVGATTRRLIDRASDSPEGEKLPPKQQAVVDVLRHIEGESLPIELHELAERAGLRTTGPIKRLLERGVLRAISKTSIEADWVQAAPDERKPEALTPAQQKVIDSVSTTLGSGFTVHLLFGVTGSGKTEVYIRLIEQVIAAGRIALLLVPEISLTPQTGGRLIGRFPDHRVAVLHSRLSAAQRHQQWSLSAAGAAQIVIGARSAVFAPIPDDRLGLIIVDEEHDSSYKQDQVPRYHGRDVAVRRGQLAHCPVLLGSATPSLESWHNATGRKIYRLHELRERVPGMRLPVVKVMDFAAEQKLHRDRRVHLIGPTLQHALRRTLEQGGQALLLLNRRGYANYIACPDQLCGWVMTCDECDVTMVYHTNRRLPTGGFVQCHHCGAQQKLPAACPLCHRRIITFGLGTQRVEEELHRKFPALRNDAALVRVDSDSMHSMQDYHDMLSRFERGEIRVLIGTHMIGKGLDFPGVRLVGVVNADTALNLPDFRATERTFQLVAQVAGRAGRSSDASALGIVIVQSFNPQTPAIQFAAQHDFASFAREELKQRSRCGLPPVTRMARIVIRDEDHVRCATVAGEVAEGLRGLADPAVRVRGPAPCPIARIAGRHRQQVEVMTPGATMMQRLLTEARNRGLLKPGAGMAVDVDPVSLL